PKTATGTSGTLTLSDVADFAQIRCASDAWAGINSTVAPALPPWCSRRNPARGQTELRQQPLCFLLRQPASNHRLRHLLLRLAVKLMAFCELTLILTTPILREQIAP